jgi:hypothetical protein
MTIGRRHIPGHLPPRLAITLWDFTWYTRTGPGEPFHDLDQACHEAVARGYNAIRICAAPFFLFRSGLDTSAVTFEPLGGEYGQRTRWYDVRQRTTIDLRRHLTDLLRAARRHGLVVILSSWEYQQSPCFSADPAWHRELMTVAPKNRFDELAEAWTGLLGYVDEQGLSSVVAYTEVHNEVPTGFLLQALEPGEDPVIGLRPYLEDAISTLADRFPGQLFTAGYNRVPVGRMRGLAANSMVAHVHAYAYGMLADLIDRYGLRDAGRPFPQAEVRSALLRDGAPDLQDWGLPPQAAWKNGATIVPHREIYVHDWADPDKWDRWMYREYGPWRIGLERELRTQLEVTADWAIDHDVPTVVGEGYVGYTPLLAGFEGGPVGADLCRQAVENCARLGFWGAVTCSNAAPHHPMWGDVELQRRLNAILRDGA